MQNDLFKWYAVSEMNTKLNEMRDELLEACEGNATVAKLVITKLMDAPDRLTDDGPFAGLPIDVRKELLKILYEKFG